MFREDGEREASAGSAFSSDEREKERELSADDGWVGTSSVQKYQPQVDSPIFTPSPVKDLLPQKLNFN